MSELQDLYQQLIIDHGRNPRNFGKLDHATHFKEGYNPLCGDRIIIYLYQEESIIKQASFEGSGCAISMASASLMTEALKGKTMAEAKVLFDHFIDLVMGADQTGSPDKLGKLMVLAGVAEYPMRVKCATLCWHAAMAALADNKEQALVSTE